MENKIYSSTQYRHHSTFVALLPFLPFGAQVTAKTVNRANGINDNVKFAILYTTGVLSSRINVNLFTDVIDSDVAVEMKHKVILRPLAQYHSIVDLNPLRTRRTGASLRPHNLANDDLSMLKRRKPLRL